MRLLCGKRCVFTKSLGYQPRRALHVPLCAFTNTMLTGAVCVTAVQQQRPQRQRVTTPARSRLYPPQTSVNNTAPSSLGRVCACVNISRDFWGDKRRRKMASW